jgi:hypothetical protein
MKIHKRCRTYKKYKFSERDIILQKDKPWEKE